MTRDGLILALGIISGRIKNYQELDSQDWHNLGYNPYTFDYYGMPSEYDIKRAAEDIIFEEISNL